ncbi:MAG: helix-turn-helix domain-containing protein [Rhodanobacteraceae bacterium]|nr:helix-turn-helix domain-containing protein [Rhodanobacteraceae bacterium]
MSIPFWNWAWRQEQLTSIETLLLLSLADMADDAGHSFPGIKMLAKRCRTSERTIQRCIAALKERGLLQVRPRIVEGQQSSNFYTLVADLGAPNAKKGQGESCHPVSSTSSPPRHLMLRRVTAMSPKSLRAHITITTTVVLSWNFRLASIRCSNTLAWQSCGAWRLRTPSWCWMNWQPDVSCP